jgi:hypothetical protein
LPKTLSEAPTQLLLVPVLPETLLLRVSWGISIDGLDGQLI